MKLLRRSHDFIPATSPDLKAEQIEQFKALFPSVVSEGKIDFEKLRALLGDEVDARPERYSFTWAGKRDAIRALQTPSDATLIPAPDESVNFEATKNLFVEGDNLEVLKLLHKAYFGRVKLIYIDPPYNTGNDFIYPDDYSQPLDRYLALTGQADDSGNRLTTNAETSGRFHSAWLTMMYPRLFLARMLLRDDGVIVVSISDAEIHNLRQILDEIFGADNLIGCVVWNSTKSVTNTALISVSHTYNLIYARDIDYFVAHRSHFRLPEDGEGFANPDNDPRGQWKADPFQVGGERPNQRYPVTNPKTGEVYRPNPGNSWKNEYKVFQQLLADNRIVFGASGEAGPQRKRFLHEALERGQVAKTLWTDVDTTTNATRQLKQLMGQVVFDNPKPPDLIRRFIQLGVHDPNDAIVLDFFAGSCTTAQAVLEANREDGGNRRFIMVQLPEPTGNPQYPTIAEIGKERIRRVIGKLADADAGTLPLSTRATPEDLGFRVFTLASPNVRQWHSFTTSSGETYVQALADFDAPLDPVVQTLNTIWEVALREGYSLTSHVERLPAVTGQTVYRVVDPYKEQSFTICLDDRFEFEALSPLRLAKDDLFVCRDSALDDTTAANLTLRCRLKVI